MAKFTWLAELFLFILNNKNNWNSYQLAGQQLPLHAHLLLPLSTQLRIPREPGLGNWYPGHGEGFAQQQASHLDLSAWDSALPTEGTRWPWSMKECPFAAPLLSVVGFLTVLPTPPTPRSTICSWIGAYVNTPDQLLLPRSAATPCWESWPPQPRLTQSQCQMSSQPSISLMQAWAPDKRLKYMMQGLFGMVSRGNHKTLRRLTQ